MTLLWARSQWSDGVMHKRPQFSFLSCRKLFMRTTPVQVCQIVQNAVHTRPNPSFKVERESGPGLRDCKRHIYNFRVILFQTIYTFKLARCLCEFSYQ